MTPLAALNWMYLPSASLPMTPVTLPASSTTSLTAGVLKKVSRLGHAAWTFSSTTASTSPTFLGLGPIQGAKK